MRRATRRVRPPTSIRRKASNTSHIPKIAILRRAAIRRSNSNIRSHSNTRRAASSRNNIRRSADQTPGATCNRSRCRRHPARGNPRFAIRSRSHNGNRNHHNNRHSQTRHHHRPNRVELRIPRKLRHRASRRQPDSRSRRRHPTSRKNPKSRCIRRRSRRFPIRRRCFPGSTRLPAASSPSRPRWTRRCSSARSR